MGSLTEAKGKPVMEPSEHINVDQWLTSIGRRGRTPWGTLIAPTNYQRVAEGEIFAVSCSYQYWYAGSEPTLVREEFRRGLRTIFVKMASPAVLWNRYGKVYCCATDSDFQLAGETPEPVLLRRRPRPK